MYSTNISSVIKFSRNLLFNQEFGFFKTLFILVFKVIVSVLSEPYARSKLSSKVPFLSYTSTFQTDVDTVTT